MFNSIEQTFSLRFVILVAKSKNSLSWVIVEENVRSGRYPASISPVRLSSRTQIFLSGAPLIVTFFQPTRTDQISLTKFYEYLRVSNYHLAQGTQLKE